MITYRRKILMMLMQLFDLFSFVAAFFVSAIARYRETGPTSFSEFLSLRIKVQNFLIFVGFMIIWHLVLRCFGLYSSRRLSSRKKDALDVLKSTLIAAAVFSIAAVVLDISMVTPGFLGVFILCTSGFVLSSRFFLRFLLAHIRRQGRNLRHVLIVGTNRRATEFAARIESKKELGYRIIGFADNQWPGLKIFEGSKFKRILELSQLSSFIENNSVDEVIIALPMKSYYEIITQVISICEQQGIIIRILSDLFNFHLGKPCAEDIFENFPVVTIKTGALKENSEVLKRTIDIIFSSLGILILSPLFILISIFIKATSRGPIFFYQMRAGINKRSFKMIKFRTMVKDADKLIDSVAHLNQADGPAFKINNDPRITKFGRLLRKTSLDELPQLFNILKGNMSLIGPRPLSYWEFSRIKNPAIKRRYSVRPGLTGLWQVSGRSNLNFEERIKMDLAYIDNWSLTLDFRILIKTFLIVVNGKGAA